MTTALAGTTLTAIICYLGCNDKHCSPANLSWLSPSDSRDILKPIGGVVEADASIVGYRLAIAANNPKLNSKANQFLRISE